MNMIKLSVLITISILFTSDVAVAFQGGVTHVVGTRSAFAAVKEDGSVVTWGDAVNGGDSSEVSEDLRSSVKEIFSNAYAFAALKEDGSVVTWGNPRRGGDSSQVASQLNRK